MRGQMLASGGGPAGLGLSSPAGIGDPALPGSLGLALVSQGCPGRPQEVRHLQVVSRAFLRKCCDGCSFRISSLFFHISLWMAAGRGELFLKSSFLKIRQSRELSFF